MGREKKAPVLPGQYRCGACTCRGQPLPPPSPRSSCSARLMGTVQNFGVGPVWKQPDATHIVKYQCKDTGTRALEGRVACKLAADNYGCNEWWVLLEPEPS